MNVQQKRACTQGENQRKGQHARAPLRQPSATAPTRRQCANRARHTKGARQNLHSAWFSKHTTWTLGFSTRHACNTLISSTEKFCAQSFPHGTSWQQQWDMELRKTQQVETRFKTRQLQHAPSPDWARFPNCVQFFKSPDSAPSVEPASFSRGFKSGIANKRVDCCIEPNCCEWNICQQKLRK